ncbi:hypothetical protein [Stappia sp. WLB 29]|uniref:hypothetical protein n=1 Tax=Stappia sp. WLB 29 TaxID=2925220 RepID=UPI0020BD91CF|nr:hypothetical protein [Stappia sp. WLB 29]
MRINHRPAVVHGREGGGLPRRIPRCGGAIKERTSVTHDISGNMQQAHAGVVAISGNMQSLSAETERVEQATVKVREASRSIA